MPDSITLTMADGAIVEALHIRPTSRQIGGVVLVQEIFGLTQHIAEQCELFGSQGFEVLAPALFDRERPGLRLSYSPDDVAQAIGLVRAHPFEQSLSDVATCVDVLGNNGPVAMVGYCYGGSVAYASACRLPGLVAASCYYGGMLPVLADQAPLCPTLVNLGALDQEIPLEIVEPMLRQHGNVQTAVYPAGHGFNSDRRSDYDARSAELARIATIELFRSAMG